MHTFTYMFIRYIFVYLCELRNICISFTNLRGASAKEVFFFIYGFIDFNKIMIYKHLLKPRNPSSKLPTPPGGTRSPLLSVKNVCT